jgi:SAM-dependent methyltransferase
MGFYAKYVLPRLIEIAMRNKDTARLHAEWIPHARGEVLEIGIGSGLNLEFYSPEVQRVYGVDPSAELRQMARKRVRKSPVEVQFLSQSAEDQLPLPNASIDTAVVTWTLCSIPNPSNALQQAKRVLKPTGRLIFVEHGRSSDPGVVMARSDNSSVEAHRRRLPPQSQDRRSHCWSRISDCRAEDELSSGAASYDLHVSGVRESHVMHHG